MDPEVESRLRELEAMDPQEFSIPVEAGKIAEFADAVRDPDGAFRDPEAARERGLPGVPAPLTFTETYRHERARQPPYPPDEFFDERGAIHGGQAFEYHRTPVAGDRFHASRRLEEFYTKSGGDLLFGVFVTEYEDEGGEPVVTTRKTRVIVGGVEA